MNADLGSEARSKTQEVSFEDSFVRGGQRPHRDESARLRPSFLTSVFCARRQGRDAALAQGGVGCMHAA